ncbi:hypothetical protein PL81_10215, partial [Streptomyces sp. RSD-27]
AGLAGHQGTLGELIALAGKATPAESQAFAEPEPTQPPAAAHEPGDRTEQPPHAPRTHHERAALTALDLLYSLAPAGTPLPADPGTLAFLAHHRQEDAPGLATPRWLARACADAGVEPPHGAWHTAPAPEEIRAERPRSWGSSARLTEEAYTQGLLPADELPGLLPARAMLLQPHDWSRLAFASAWRTALARLLRTELGTDPDRWLRLAHTATRAAGLDRPTEDGGPSWVELLERSRSAGAPPAGHLPCDPPARGASSSPPNTPDEALRLLR